MNIGKFFNVRFFVISSVLVSGLILNVIMISGEEVAQPRTVENTQRQVSRLKKLRYVISDRKKNVGAIGAPERVNKECYETSQGLRGCIGIPNRIRLSLGGCRMEVVVNPKHGAFAVKSLVYPIRRI